MNAATPEPDHHHSRWLEWISNLVAVAVILAELVGVSLFLLRVAVPTPVAYAGTAAIAIIIGGSALYVGLRYRTGSGTAGEGGEKSAPARVAEVVVSVTVLTAVTVILGSLGGLVLSVIAMVGGPDPKTGSGDRLRHRLLRWPQRNRDFMRDNGTGRLPLRP